MDRLINAMEELLHELYKMDINELKAFREEYKEELERNGTEPRSVKFIVDVIDVVIERKAGRHVINEKEVI